MDAMSAPSMLLSVINVKKGTYWIVESAVDNNRAPVVLEYKEIAHHATMCIAW